MQSTARPKALTGEAPDLPPRGRGTAPWAVEGVLRRRKAFVPISFMPNILLFSDARQAYDAHEAHEAHEAYEAQEAYEAYEAQEPIFLKKDRLFLIGNFINRRFSEISCAL